MTDSLGARLAQARRELAVREGRDITPSALAAELGVTPATVYRWESDEKRPRDEMLIALAQRLGVTPGWLAYGQLPKLAPGVTPLGGDPMEFINPETDRKLTDEEIERAKRIAASRAAKPPRKREKGA